MMIKIYNDGYNTTILTLVKINADGYEKLY